jgi:CubicO group peptidase (beta-lactamase class C family)
MDPIHLVTRLPLPFLTRCRVPSDVREVRSEGEEVPARQLGLTQGRVEAVWEAAEALYRAGVHPALQLCIRHRGEVVLNRALGHASGNAPQDPPDAPKELATTETPFCIYSASKAVTAMVIHKLDEQRLIHLEDRVCDFIPEFGCHGKDRITIRHILAHRAGIPNLPPESIDLDLLGHPDRVVKLLSEARPRTRPGRLLAYHAVSGGFVLGEVVRRVTGRDIRKVLEKEILKPLGMRWMRYGVAAADVGKVAVNAFTGPPIPPPMSRILRNALGTTLEGAVDLSNDPRFLTGIIPAANVVTTADELSAFFECLLREGELDGVRVFDPRTVRHATAEQSYWELDLTLGMPIRYGLGFMLGGPISLYGTDAHEAFGHIGLSNVIGWADPERDISVALLTSGKALLSLHVVRLYQLLTEIGNAFPKRRRLRKVRRPATRRAAGTRGR